MDPKRLETIFFLILFLGVALLSAFIFLPYIGALILAITFAVTFMPLYRWLVEDMGGHKTLAAFVMVFLVLLILIAPLTYFGFQIFRESRDLYARITSGDNQLLSQIANSIENKVREFNPNFSLNLRDYMGRGLGWFSSHLGAIFSSLTNVFINLFIALFALFYLFKDGDRLKKFFIRYSPLSPHYNEEILNRLDRTLTSVIRGTLIVALIQGFVAGIGFLLFGVPNPAFWGALVVIAALVPTAGVAIVMIPAAAYLYINGNVLGAAGLLAWGVLIVGLIDNVLRPFLIEKGVNIHPLIILLSVVGGLQLFGPIGFVAGPVVVSLFFTLLNIYSTLIVKASEGNGRKRNGK